MAANTDDNNRDKNEEVNSGQKPQSQQNNGNIGREEGVDEEGKGSLGSISEDENPEKPVNEDGVGENQESHWTGNHGQKSSNRPHSRDRDSYNDQNPSDGAQQNNGRNHVANAGGTSQEDIEKGNTGLRDGEDSDRR